MRRSLKVLPEAAMMRRAARMAATASASGVLSEPASSRALMKRFKSIGRDKKKPPRLIARGSCITGLFGGQEYLRRKLGGGEGLAALALFAHEASEGRDGFVVLAALGLAFAQFAGQFFADDGQTVVGFLFAFGDADHGFHDLVEALLLLLRRHAAGD